MRTWTAVCADTKPVPFWTVGNRSTEAAIELMNNLRTRLAERVQLISDTLKAYLDAIEGAIRDAVDYAMLVKLSGSTVGSSPEHRHSLRANQIGMPTSNAAIAPSGMTHWMRTGSSRSGWSGKLIVSGSPYTTMTPQDTLGSIPPAMFRRQVEKAGNSILELST